MTPPPVAAPAPPAPVAVDPARRGTPTSAGGRTRRPAVHWCWSGCCWSRSTCGPS
ncbi:hypothetical protein NKG94_33860 [Micromonospora sp. M12]